MNLFGGFFKDKKVLITGHTGFKGAWLSSWLLELQAKVIGYSLRPPTEPNLFDICGLEKEMVSVLGDTRHFGKLKRIMESHQPEIVFHLAAQSLVRVSYRKPVETYATNVLGTVHLLEACRQTPSVKAIVNVTSDKCYENKDLRRGYRENDPLGGSDPYSSSKGCAELVTAAYIRSYFPQGHDGTPALASARAGNVIGGGDWAKDRIVPDCVRALLSKKSIVVRYPDAVRPWQFVLEPLSGYLRLAQRLYQDGRVFAGAWNFGPDDDSLKPVRWIVERVIEYWGEPGTWNRDQGSQLYETGYLKLDSSKARTSLPWRPQWDLDFGLSQTMDWYKAYRDKKNLAAVILRQIRSFARDMQGRSR